MDKHYKYSLKTHNTFGVDIKSGVYVEVKNIQELLDLIANLDSQSKNWMVIGEGSNILFTKDYEGTIIRILNKEIEAINENDHEITLRVGAGHSWSGFVDFCVSKNYWGIENLALIPGTVGAAPIQNIGAYGMEVKDSIEWVEGIDTSSGNIKTLQNADCHFAYRSSIFKTSMANNFIVTAVVFRLHKKGKPVLTYDPLDSAFAEPPTLLEISSLVKETRKQKLPDPKELGNAGSFFKNPVVSEAIYRSINKKYPNIPAFKTINNTYKIPAAWLIEQAGLKGFRSGKVGIYEKHALVLVNYGGADGHEIFQFSIQVAGIIMSTFGIELFPEVQII